MSLGMLNARKREKDEREGCREDQQFGEGWFKVANPADSLHKAREELLLSLVQILAPLCSIRIFRGNLITALGLYLLAPSSDSPECPA